MRKIPSLFKRDPRDRRRFLPEHAVTLPPDAIATVKWDGTAVELDAHGKWWVRHEVKGHHDWPVGYRHVEHDPITHKDVGWVPLDFDDPAHEVIADAIVNETRSAWLLPGTYEAMGPERGIIGRPHLIPHDGRPEANIVTEGCPTDYTGLTTFMFARPWMEGIVWWHDGQPVAKVRRLDLGLPWPAVSAGEQGRSRSPSDSTLPPGAVDSPAGVRRARCCWASPTAGGRCALDDGHYGDHLPEQWVDPAGAFLVPFPEAVDSPDAGVTITPPSGVRLADVHWSPGEKPGTIIATWTELVE